MLNLPSSALCAAFATGARLYYNPLVSVTSISQPAANPAKRGGFFRTFWRALRQLFHETTGALFALLALAAVNSGVRAWENGVAKWIVALPVGYAMAMVYFSFTSFRSARRVR